jgi:hypothetical protein
MISTIVVPIRVSSAWNHPNHSAIRMAADHGPEPE